MQGEKRYSNSCLANNVPVWLYHSAWFKVGRLPTNINGRSFVNHSPLLADWNSDAMLGGAATIL